VPAALASAVSFFLEQLCLFVFDGGSVCALFLPLAASVWFQLGQQVFVVC